MKLTRFLVLAGVAITVVAGCGRPATEAECEEIVERTARLKIQETSPMREEAVDSEVAELKDKLRDKIMQGCVGKRVTQRAMRCVRDAPTSEAVKECFR
jgi:small lipoprotein (TIGR04454 family)